jgi:hypothetical protein
MTAFDPEQTFILVGRTEWVATIHMAYKKPNKLRCSFHSASTPINICPQFVATAPMTPHPEIEIDQVLADD